MRRIAGIWWLIMLVGTAYAQDKPAPTDPAPLRIGLGLTGITYQGDLNQNDGDYLRVYPGMHLSLHFDKPRRIQPQLNLGFGKFVAQADQITLPSSDGVSPNTFVETSLFLLDLRLRIWIVRRGRIRPFVGVGGGLIFFTPRDQNGNFLIDNIFSRFQGETYPAFLPVLPLDLGVDLRINERVGLGLTYTYRQSGSDYLDNLGQLGPVAGNDRLHTLTLSLSLSLQTPQLLLNLPAPQPQPTPQPDSAPPAPQVADISPPQPDTTQHAAEANALAAMGASELMWRLPRREGAESHPYVLYHREGAQATRQIQVEQATEVSRLPELWDIRPEQFLRLNPDLPDLVPAGTQLWLP